MPAVPSYPKGGSPARPAASLFSLTPSSLTFSSVSKTASSSTLHHSQALPSLQAEISGLNSRPRCHPRVQPVSQSTGRSEWSQGPSSLRRGCYQTAAPTRPSAVRLANPVNYVPRSSLVTVPRQISQLSDENLPLDRNRDAFPLLSIPERRRSRLTPSQNSLVVERSQEETEGGRTSIALPWGQCRSGAFAYQHNSYYYNEMAGPAATSISARATDNLDPPDAIYLSLDNRPRHVSSQLSLRSQAQIATVPSNTTQNNAAGGIEVGNVGPDVAEELAWGPAHPCFPHPNPHVPVESNEYQTTRVIRIRRDWMVRGDLAPTFSNLYPEILDPLLPEQEFRRVIAHINEELIKAFDPFRLRNIVDSALGLLTGWLYEDFGGPAIKRDLYRVETWINNWNQEVGAKDGVYIWSLRRTAYMALDIQIPDPKVGIIPSRRESLHGAVG